MLGTHLVIRAVVTTFHQTPERLQAVCMSSITDVFSSRMRHTLMQRQSAVRFRIICVRPSPLFTMAASESLECWRICGPHNPSSDSSCAPFLQTGDSRFTDGTATTTQFPVRVFVLLLTTEVSLVCLNFSLKLTSLIVTPRFANAMRQVPSSLLGNVQVTMKSVAATRRFDGSTSSLAALGQLRLRTGSFQAHAPLGGHRLVPVFELP